MQQSSVKTFTDPDQYQAAVQPADLRIVITGRGDFHAELTQVKLDDLWAQRGHFSLPSVVHSKIPKDRRMFFLQFDSAQAPIAHSGTDVAPTEIICYPLEADHHYRTSSEYSCGGMSLSESAFNTYEEIIKGRLRPPPVVKRVVRPEPAKMSRLLNVHKAATNLAATAPDILHHSEVKKAIEQELVRAIIDCTEDLAFDKDHSQGRQRLSVMSRFEQLLRDQPAEPLYVTDICAGIGVSERTLRLHCHDQLGMSPQKYLWIRRMNMAQRALLHAQAARTTVTVIANDHGFAELGRFAVGYRRLFGEPPSTTLRRPC